MYIAGPGGVKAPENCSHMFYGGASYSQYWGYHLQAISLQALDVSSVIDMSNMFDGCSKLTSLTFGENWNTSNVTNMTFMFANCSSLTSITFEKTGTPPV